MSKFLTTLIFLFAFLHGGGRLALSVGIRQKGPRLINRLSEVRSIPGGEVTRGPKYRVNTYQRKREVKKRGKENFFIGCTSNPSGSRKDGYRQKGNVRRKKTFLFDEGENEKMESVDPELYESLSGCIENEMKDNYLDSMIECTEDDYHSEDVHYEADDLSEETKRKKYHTYGRRFSDKDFGGDNVHRYYQHLPIYYDGENDGPMKKFKRVYNANKIENLERNIREEDLYYPSVPVHWKVYVCLLLDKKYNYENENDKQVYERFNKNVRHRYALEFLSWVKLSTRIYQNTSKVLMTFNLKRKENIFGNLLFFTSVNLHYADMFLKSNPYVKLGLCEELYLYAYEQNNDHFLLGTFPNLFLQKNYLFIKFFNQDKLNHINDLYEKHMRFFIRSNMIFKLGVLKQAPKDNLKDLFLTTKQYLPITEAQTKNVLAQFDEEMGAFEHCSSVEVDSDSTIRQIKSAHHRMNVANEAEKMDSANASNSDNGDNDADARDDVDIGGAPTGKFARECLAELTIANCKDEEEAQEFLEKDPYTRSCLYESIFFCEVREVAPHVQYTEGYIPKAKNYMDYHHEVDTNLNPNYDLEEKPEYMENRSLAQKKFANHEKVDMDILDTFIKLKYTNREVDCEGGEAEQLAPEKDLTTAENESEATVESSPQPPIALFNSRKKKKRMNKRYRVKIVDYENEYMEYLCNVQNNKIVHLKKEERNIPLDEVTPCPSRDIYDVLVEDMKNPKIYRKKDIILVDNTLQFFDHIFFKDYLSNFVYITLPPGEFIEEAYAIKDEKNYDFTIFNNSLASQEDFLKRQNYQPRFLKGIWLKKDQSKILFYDKQNNALMYGTGIDKTFSWDKKVHPRIMKRALINMEIALETIRQGSCILNDDITANQETERTIKEYTNEYTSFEQRFTAPHNQLVSSHGYPDYKPPPGLEYLNPHIWEKTPEEHKELILDTDRVQKIHSKFLKKLELYKASIDDDPFTQEVPTESDILGNSNMVQVDYL
ncbi:hypothetical protein, conserved in Apicomplexan species [Plasmodium knowlesi strain H]|uniref:Uncharacterized protein n=3 Tax=Plasmodium knowlesi TaxID=5850 RepID=A0A5K1TZN6_PLAKH|nr:uncharacterized protein PKNH_1448100 [Plasmodium knowlesi strain H]OTN64275.1 Uncharacterized protein PKNOH_S140266200 [Plasmodium knowlesi]CAA9991076.1 hypothetical protein, conserved in Apicomplexan species [Plasmodium knowlesi strain H]SBO20630.1 hypothetical protein, conserved in Apicomplexan species [Plasmodium knowlesi strain H]SBO21040.1 hypothetical protein, conserved in Apicomplexan species [Plasmodium knowlesi strain H]VVS80550.1 hypothetical protein, conserved in Apicomplexan spe|eukprot:XP_002262358.1 [Plasmodium knowlesi strain H]